MSTYDEESKIWSGPVTDYPYSPNTTFGEIILQKLQEFPEKTAQISDDDGYMMSCEEMRTLCIRVAQHLTSRGFIPGDIVGIVAKNSTYLAPVVFGCFLAGLPVNTLDPQFEKDDIVHMFKQTKPQLIFCDADCLGNVQEALLELEESPKVFTLLEEVAGMNYVEEIFSETGTEEEFVPMDFGDASELICIILCSSGTTGYSKGVEVSHAQCLALLNLGMRGIDQLQSIFSFSSLYWFTGFVCLVTPIINHITRITTTKPFTTEYFFELIEKYNIQFVFLPPSLIATILHSSAIEEANLDSIRVFVSGGSFVSPYLVENLNRYLKHGRVFVTYGMTEVGGTITFSDGSAVSGFGSVGKLSSNKRVKVVDDGGNVLGNNETGQLFLKSIFPFLGYFGNEAATREVIDEEGWIISGDIGYFDDEGNLFLVDRKKDILKYAGYQISPSELEAFLQKINGVSMACVVGVPDELHSTDFPAAIVVKTPDSELVEDDILAITVDGLPDYKQFRGGVYFVDEFPMTPSGKIKKRLMKELAINKFYGR